MHTFESIDLDDLDRVSGGQATTTTAEGTLKTPAGEATLKAGQSSEEPNKYNRCLKIVGGQAGLLESPNNVAARQEKLCGPLLNQPGN